MDIGCINQTLCNAFQHGDYLVAYVQNRWETKVRNMLTLTPEMFTAEVRIVVKVILCKPLYYSRFHLLT